MNKGIDFVRDFPRRFTVLTPQVLKLETKPSLPQDPIVSTDVIGETASAPDLEATKSTDTQDVLEEIKEIGRETAQEIMQTQAAVEDVIASQPQAGSQTSDFVVDRKTDLEMHGILQIALTANDGFMDTVELIASRTGRRPQNTIGDHVETRIQLFGIAEDLKDRIAISNRFVLPMIYGSLGAALFCLVRVLTPSLSDLGPGRAILRVLFGAFAAMTLSMLFIPANVFSINSQSNPTMIFLACFLFGYSFDAVLAALHRLEEFLQGRLKTPEGTG